METTSDLSEPHLSMFLLDILGPLLSVGLAATVSKMHQQNNECIFGKRGFDDQAYLSSTTFCLALCLPSQTKTVQNTYRLAKNVFVGVT